jgi:Tat protein translocase TatC
MSAPKDPADELAGTEQPFVQHLMELRDRLLYGMAGLGICMAILAFWPGPSGLIDLIAVPIRAHMPPDAKLIAVGVFSPFFVPLKVLAMAALLLSLPWWMYQIWAFVAPGLYSHEKRFAVPLIVLGSLLAYVGIAFVQFFVLDKMFGFIQQFTPKSVAATPDIASYVLCRGHSLALPGVRPGLPGAHRGGAAGQDEHGHGTETQGVPGLLHRRGVHRGRGGHAAGRDFPACAGGAHVRALRNGHLGCPVVHPQHGGT